MKNNLFNLAGALKSLVRQSAGIIFIDQEGSNGPGVRLKKPLP